MATMGYHISDLRLTSYWSTNSSGALVGQGSEATGTRDVAIAVPEGYIVTSAILSVKCGISATGTRILQVNGETLNRYTGNTIDFTDFVLERTSDMLEFEFHYAENGAGGKPNKTSSCTMTFTEMMLSVTWEEETPEPEEVEDRPLRTEAPVESIVLCDGFTRGVISILHPQSCTIMETAGGEYELSMTHPMDGDTWTHIKTERLIRAPVPENHLDGVEVQNPTLWQTTEATVLWKKTPSWYTKKDTTTILAYSSTTRYKYGDKCLYNDNIYRFTETAGYAPAPAAYPWVYVSSSSEGTGSTSYTRVEVPGVKAEDLEAETYLIMISGYNDTYMRVQAPSGKYGYVEISKVQEQGVYSGDPVYSIPPKDIVRQYFRIYSVEVSSYESMVTVNARHISYDLDCMLLDDCSVIEASPQLAINFMRACFMEEHLQGSSQTEVSVTKDERIIATDITEGSITQDWSKSSPVSALLDPDTGIVSLIKARLYRDDDDYILLNNGSRDSEYTIRYGTNLIGVTYTTDISEVVTRIIPVAQNQDGEPYKLPEVYIDSALIEKYAVIRYETLDVDAKIGEVVETTGGDMEEHTEAVVCQMMRDAAKKRFDEDLCDQPKIEMTVEFALLGDSEEYAQYRGLQSLNIYDIVRIVHPGIGVDILIQVTGYEWDAILRRYTSITLGDPFDYGTGTVAGYQIGTRAVGERTLSPALRTRLNRIEQQL